MAIKFHKYQGTGNDFIIIDNRKNELTAKSAEAISRYCSRGFGIGADGLILIENAIGYDFRMIYFNSDGNEGSMCGNGGRCASAFALINHIAGERQYFIAADGPHEAIISGTADPSVLMVKLKMKDVEHIERVSDYMFIDTGSPHFIVVSEDVRNTDVLTEGRKIRHSERFRQEGTNVDFIQQSGKGIYVRTYERGVEDETLSCGTGVTASALAAAESGMINSNECEVETPGGKLKVYFEKKEDKYVNIWLEGPASFVFEGKYSGQ